MRSYDVAIASLAVGAPIKWTDNVLSQHAIPDIVSERRGVSRKISHAGVVRLAIIRELHVTLGMSVRDAISLAGALLDDPASTVLPGGHVRVILDRQALEHSVDARLREALESAPSPRRGRPPTRKSQR